MSNLYLASSLATSAVLLSGLSVDGLSCSVRTFHVPRFRALVFCFFVFELEFRPL